MPTKTFLRTCANSHPCKMRAQYRLKLPRYRPKRLFGKCAQWQPATKLQDGVFHQGANDLPGAPGWMAADNPIRCADPPHYHDLLFTGISSTSSPPNLTYEVSSGNQVPIGLTYKGRMAMRPLDSRFRGNDGRLLRSARNDNLWPPACEELPVHAELPVFTNSEYLALSYIKIHYFSI